MGTPPTTRRGVRPEDGATLVLALVFMIIVAVVLLAAVTFSGNGLRNTSNLLGQQSLEYRSAGALQVAIQTVRYTDTTFTSNASCLSTGTGIQIGQSSTPVYVDCDTVPLSDLPADTGVSREIDLYSCQTQNTPCSPTNYTIAATVDFVDGPTCATGSIGACGATESIKSWLVHGANS